jgi:cyclophilin family peptidyl-prolyl cis-trans isomerase/HEAT repeat protein
MHKAQSTRLKASSTHQEHGPRYCALRLVPWALCLVVVLSAACATAPAQATIEPPVISWEQKLTWMMRLEDQRIVRDPNPPAPVVLAPAATNRPAVLAPPPPSDLIRLLDDNEARVRRRAALALGRVGLSEGVEPLIKRLADEEVEVRQMAAFALGLIGDAAARPALLAALKDPSPLTQGRAAEALGLIADRADAAAVSEMVQAHVRSGVLMPIDPDDLQYPRVPEIEAARLGLYALVRLGSHEALAAAALDAGGQPVSRWWPVAYALQRIGDPRAAPALLSLLATPGRFTAAFAARGLGTLKASAAAAPLRQIVDQRTAAAAVVVQAVRALAAMQDAGSVAVLSKLVTEPQVDDTLRLEAIGALGAIRSGQSVELMLDLLSDSAPAIRGATIRALAQIDPDTFVLTLSGLDPDRDWTVRVAQAEALGTLPADRSAARLALMLQDRDQRVIPAVLAALVASKAPDAERLLVERLKTDDFMIRTAAANGLAELKATAALPALVEMYRASLGDSTYVARAAALAALNRTDAAYARPFLQEALKDREWAVRVRAATLLQQGGSESAAAGAIRPATPGRAIDDPAWRALIDPSFSPHAFIETERGTIEIELAILDAPQTVANFMALARRGFFNGLAIHRVVPDFVIQDGDPRGDGEGGPGYTIRDELNERPYLRGTVGMALDWEDTGGSQFFITHSPQPHLDDRYTVFGHVVNGMEVVDRIVPLDVIQRVRIWDGVTMTP